MKFSCSVIINKPKDEVVAYYIDPNNLVHWQDGFLGVKELSGESMQKGAVTELRYKMGRKELKLFETVIENNLPDSFFAEYECDPTHNTMLTTFEVIDANTSKLTNEIEYLRFDGMMLNILKTLFPSMFKKQVQKWLNNFKSFAEKQ